MAHNNVCNTLHACRLKREIRSRPFEKRLEYRSELEFSKKFVRHELMDSGLDLRGITLPNPIRDITLLFHADMTESGLEKGTCIYGSSGGGGLYASWPRSLVLTGMRQRPLSESAGLLQVACQQLSFSQGETTKRLEVFSFHRLREQWHGVCDAPAHGICCPQGLCHPGKPDPEIRVLTDGQSPFEEGECPWQVALPEEQQTDSPRGKHQSAGVIDRLGCSVSGTGLKGCDDPCVQGAPSLWPETLP